MTGDILPPKMSPHFVYIAKRLLVVILGLFVIAGAAYMLRGTYRNHILPGLIYQTRGQASGCGI